MQRLDLELFISYSEKIKEQTTCRSGCRDQPKFSDALALIVRWIVSLKVIPYQSVNSSFCLTAKYLFLQYPNMLKIIGVGSGLYPELL